MLLISYSFDLDTVAMRAAGLSDSEVAGAYKEMGRAMKEIGLPIHAQESVYVGEGEPDEMAEKITQELPTLAPVASRFIKRSMIATISDYQPRVGRASGPHFHRGHMH
ncbi:hypothetical protein ABIC63_002142 [Pseudacidovorax sp. 1753]|uniref:hypothetical protein n=1 Tax=Pseudacidovorax sp. 1753 TaxID=3156419 RepID=UPI00339563B0